MRTARDLEITAIGTIFYWSDLWKKEVPALDPEIFLTAEAAAVAETIATCGPHQVPVFDELRGKNKRALNFLMEVVVEYEELAVPLEVLDRQILDRLRKLKRAQAIRGVALEASSLCEQRAVSYTHLRAHEP